VTVASGSGLVLNSTALSLMSCTNGQTLSTNGTSWACSTPVVPSSPTAQTVSGASSVTFSGLDGNTDKTYEIFIRGRFYTAGANKNLRLGPNNSFATAGFRNIAYRWLDTTGTMSTDTNIRNNGGLTMAFTDWSSDGDISVHAFFNAESGRARSLDSTHLFFNTAVNATYELGAHHLGWWSNTTTNITSLVFDFNGGTFTGTISIQPRS
jgi:hypothetical protein